MCPIITFHKLIDFKVTYEKNTILQLRTATEFDSVSMIERLKYCKQ